MTTILEQMAQRFEIYASDQIAARAHHRTLAARYACTARAHVWRLAASDLRELAAALPTTDCKEAGEPVLGFTDGEGFLVVEDVQPRSAA